MKGTTIMQTSPNDDKRKHGKVRKHKMDSTRKKHNELPPKKPHKNVELEQAKGIDMSTGVEDRR